MEIRYTRLFTSPLLHQVQTIWQVTGTPLYRQEVILPKGIIELIFSFGEDVPYGRDGAVPANTTSKCFVNGMTDAPLWLDAPAYQCFFGIQLTPSAVNHLLGVPAGEFLNGVRDLTLISDEFNSLWHTMAEMPGFDQRVTIANLWMVKKFTSAAAPSVLSNYLNNKLPVTSVQQLADILSCSVRHLHRKAYELFGMSAESMIGYKRYCTALHVLHGSQYSLTDIGLTAGYYDQAHFIRDFKSYTGMTPGGYRKAKEILPAHLHLSN